MRQNDKILSSFETTDLQPITIDELDLIKERAITRRERWETQNPGVQVPPDEGVETLRLVSEITRLTQSQPLQEGL